MERAARRFRILGSFVLAAAALPCGAAAQFVPLSGNVSDGAGGPLLSGVVYHANGGVTVPAGLTLTAQPGAIVKFVTNSFLDVHGTLDVNGTAANQVIFTSLKDDSAGGDTNGDGFSSGSPVQWPGVRFNPTSDASVAEHLVVRYGGVFGWAQITLGQSDVTLTHCSIEHGGFGGLHLFDSSFPSVSGCSFIGNGGPAVVAVPIDAVPGFQDNTATGNLGGDFLDVSTTTLAADVTIEPGNLLNGVLVFSGFSVVPAGKTLTLGAGVVVKMKHSDLGADVYGQLVAQGTASAPVVFTSFADDAFGGDTNVDGPSTGSPYEWRGIRFNPQSDSSVLDHTIVRNGGNAGWAELILGQADVTLRDCTIERSGDAGMNLFGVSLPTVERCAFVDNALAAVTNASIDAVPGFLNCTASGNAGGDHIAIWNGAVSGHRTIGLANLLNGALVFYGHGNVPAGASLTLLPGVVVKMASTNLIIDVYGRLIVRGTGLRPVVFTSFTDDAHAGDTNGDGPSVGSGLGWLGIRINTGSPSVVEYARVRYGGNAGWPNLQCHSALATLRSVRVEHSGFTGFYITAHVPDPMFNLVAFGNAAVGILLGGGTQALAHATSVGNGGIGIWNLGPYAGLVTGTIAWGNLGGNFQGFAPTQVVASNGDIGIAGALGNQFQIPGFVDEAGGDLRLTPGSAMLDHADLAYASVAEKDHEENSRLLDDDVNSVALPDLGAYELAFWKMTVDGEPQLGKPLTFTVQSKPGLSIYLVGFLDGTIYTQPHGFITAGAASLIAVGTPIPVGTPLSVVIPDLPALVGIEFGVQTATFPLASPFGNITNLYRGIIMH